MVDTLIMFSDNLNEDVSHNRKVLIFIGIAVLLVALVIAVAVTWNNIQGASADFRDDCRDIGGTPHDLGNETVCLLDNRVIGRQ